MKEIYMNDSIYKLISNYPELKDILYEIGFVDIVKPVMLNTVGKLMNLEKGSKMKNIDIKMIKEKLEKEGFILKENI